MRIIIPYLTATWILFNRVYKGHFEINLQANTMIEQAQSEIESLSRSEVKTLKKKKKCKPVKNIEEPPADGPVHTKQSKRSRTLHSYLSIPLTCCLGANSKGTVTCSIDFSNNTTDNETDTMAMQDKSAEEVRVEEKKPSKPKTRRKKKTASDGEQEQQQ